MAVVFETVPEFWSLKRPGFDEPFFAVLMVDEDTDKIVSVANPDGDWVEVPGLVADLIAPEQARADWDIEKTTQSVVPKGWEEFEPKNSKVKKLVVRRRI